MTTIDVDVLIHIKRISEIMNPIQMFSFFDFQDQGIDKMEVRFAASFLQIFNVGLANGRHRLQNGMKFGPSYGSPRFRRTSRLMVDV